MIVAQRIMKRRRSLYQALRQMAEDGETCPSNSALGAMLGCTSDLAGATLMHLRDSGAISVEYYGIYRKVIIAQTGKSTAPYKYKDEEACFRPHITVRDLAKIVADVFQTSVLEIVGNSRARCHTPSRFAVYLISREVGWSYCQIARVVHRDHTSVIHGVKRAIDLAESEPGYAYKLNMIRELAGCEAQRFAA